MTMLDGDLARGIFHPPATKDLTEAFEKAERHLSRLSSAAVAEVDRDRVARRIVSEARAGETQPDLVWRAAVAKVLLEERKAAPSLGEKSPLRAAEPKTRERRETTSAAPDSMPAAGPHAAGHHTNEDATPGAGALPSGIPGDDVDPGTG